MIQGTIKERDTEREEREKREREEKERKGERGREKDWTGSGEAKVL